MTPRQGVSGSPGGASIVPNDGGDFVVETFVDDTSVMFVVDTGASDIILSLADAKRVGLDPDSFSYSRAYTTANGTAFDTPVRLGNITIGPIVLEDVRGRTMTIYQ